MMNDVDRSKFVDEMEALLPKMRAYARSLCRDETLADDLVQDACIKAWSAIDSFKPGAAMRPWLLRILRNEYFQVHRRAWRNVALEPEQAENAFVVECGKEARSEFAQMQLVINALPDAQRDALVLVAAAGFTYDEAAEICECSPGTVKSRVSRARETVKHMLAKMESGQKGALVSTKPVRAEDLFEMIDELTSRASARAA